MTLYVLATLTRLCKGCVKCSDVAAYVAPSGHPSHATRYMALPLQKPFPCIARIVNLWRGLFPALVEDRHVRVYSTTGQGIAPRDMMMSGENVVKTT